MDTWFRGFSKLALGLFTATDYFTKEDILDLHILMCRLACTPPGPMWDVHKSLMHATMEAKAWAGCVRVVGTLFTHSPPPAKYSPKDSMITNYLLPSQPKVPQGATPPLVKRSVVVQTPSLSTPAAASPAPASVSVASIPASTQKPPPTKSSLRTPTHKSATLLTAPAVTLDLKRNHEFRGRYRLSMETPPGQMPQMVLMEKVKDLLTMFHCMDSTVVLATWVVANSSPDLMPEEFPTSPHFFAPYVNRFYAQMGWAQNWLKMRFRCNQPPTFFTSEFRGISKPWFDLHTSTGYCQAC